MLSWWRPSLLLTLGEVEGAFKSVLRVPRVEGLRRLSMRPCDSDSLLKGVSELAGRHGLYVLAITPNVAWVYRGLCNYLPRERLLYLCLGVDELHEFLTSAHLTCLERVRGFVVVVSSTNEVVRAFSYMNSLRSKGLLTKELYLLLQGLESVSFNEDVLDYVLRVCGRHGVEVILSDVVPHFLTAWGFVRGGRAVNALGLTLEEFRRGCSRVYLTSGIDSNGVLAFGIEEAELLAKHDLLSGIGLESTILTCPRKLRMLDSVVVRMISRLRPRELRASPCIVVRRGCMKAVIDEEFVSFLKLVDELGSFSRAAGRLGVPLSTMRKRLCVIEDVLGVRLVVTSKGGVMRGGAVLTDRGRALIRVFERLREGFAKEFVAAL